MYTRKAHAQKIEAQLKAEVSAVTTPTEAADQASVVEGMDIPAEIAGREIRLQALAEAQKTIETRASRLPTKTSQTAGSEGYGKKAPGPGTEATDSRPSR